MQIALTPELAQLVDSQVATGAYRSASEVIREALQLLVERDAASAVPEPQQVRVAGRLESMRQGGSFELTLRGGRQLHCTASGLDARRVGDLLGGRVVVSGLASFVPAGDVDHIDATHIERASGDVTLWEKEPRPISGNRARSRFRVPQDRATGIEATFGKWPGQESDEEVFRALDELS